MTNKALYMDAGNSAIKYCLQDAFSESRSLLHGEYEINRLLDSLIEQNPIDQIYLASVYKPSFGSLIAEWADRQTIEFHEIKTTSKFSSLINGYHHYDRLGVDRWLAMIALHEKYRNQFLVISAGSAVTCDLVDDAGKHKGGLIMPGLNMMQKSLLENTAAVRFTENNTYLDEILQKDTASCVIAGTFNAVIGMIEKIIKNYALSPEQIVLTGGQAKLLASGLPYGVVVEDHLVLKGIACWHQYGESA